MAEPADSWEDMEAEAQETSSNHPPKSRSTPVPHFSFNPNAPSFSFNPAAATFTPPMTPSFSYSAAARTIAAPVKEVVASTASLAVLTPSPSLALSALSSEPIRAQDGPSVFASLDVGKIPEKQKVDDGTALGPPQLFSQAEEKTSQDVVVMKGEAIPVKEKELSPAEDVANGDRGTLCFDAEFAIS